MVTVSLAILHFGKMETTQRCLDSLEDLQLNGIKLFVIVINNDINSPFKESRVYKNFSIEIHNNTNNNGFSGGHNQGFVFAQKKDTNYHVILNNDVIVDRDLISELISVAKKFPDSGALSPMMYFTKGHEYHKDRYKKGELGKVIWYAGGIIDWDNLINKHRGVDEVDTGQYNRVEETDFATGACMMMPTTVLKKVGGFDERYFLYYEDGDLNIRIKKNGYKVLFVPSAKLWHNNAGSSSSGSALQDYYISRNRMLFGMTYAPLRTKVALIRESVSILKNGREWQKKGILDFYKRKFGRGSYPI